MEASRFSVNELKEVIFNNTSVIYVFVLQGGSSYITLQDMMDYMPYLDQ